MHRVTSYSSFKKEEEEEKKKKKKKRKKKKKKKKKKKRNGAVKLYFFIRSLFFHNFMPINNKDNMIFGFLEQEYFLFNRP